MDDLIDRKPIKLYQAKVLDLDDVVEQREFAVSLGAKINLNQAWQLVIGKVKMALLRDIERHIQIKATEKERGKLLLEASIWIEVPEGGADNGWDDAQRRGHGRHQEQPGMVPATVGGG